MRQTLAQSDLQKRSCAEGKRALRARPETTELALMIACAEKFASKSSGGQAWAEKYELRTCAEKLVELAQRV